MRNKDEDLDAIGAEALPGGLQELQGPGNGPAKPATPPPRTRAAPPLVGLLALVRAWMQRRNPRA